MILILLWVLASVTISALLVCKLVGVARAELETLSA
ncbi:protein of unknown function [Beijerinckiaceae bacterium RH AL1]|jgi:hypothetical protein|nr:protein of unknown function [Beijerinckiaceae bacterium RH CH11]VVB43876.1 protein of unknown function [Beijerinckiaceae bacterium RH AL8]VVC54043.1 protein of unknown function [Beijerinckiaceae bacterium RH AL1]